MQEQPIPSTIISLGITTRKQERFTQRPLKLSYSYINMARMSIISVDASYDNSAEL